MLVIARKENEVIKIGDDIEIKILNIGQNTVKLGIEAPKEVLISREELLNEIKNTNITTANSQKQIDSKTNEILSSLKEQLFKK